MEKRKVSWPKKIMLSLLVLIILIAVGAGLFLKTSTYDALLTAQKISEKAQNEKNYLLFPSNKKNQMGLIFYPGAFVKPESYSEWAEQVANAGYDVYIMKMPLNLAVLSADAANSVIESHPGQKFVLAGHSLGGVMASRYIAGHPDQEIVGMAFLASYPDAKGSLVDSELPVLSLTASNDGVLNWDNYEKNRVNLPEDTNYQSIKGGNHGGFGNYGQQKGDKKATISNSEQQKEISKQLIDWLIQIGM